MLLRQLSFSVLLVITATYFTKEVIVIVAYWKRIESKESKVAKEFAILGLVAYKPVAILASQIST